MSKTNKFKNVIIYILLILTVLFASCSKAVPSVAVKETITATPTANITLQPTPTCSPTPEPDTPLEAELESPRLIGSSRAFLCGNLISEKDIKDVGFLLKSKDGSLVTEIEGILFEDKYYAKIDNLSDDTEYSIKMYYTDLDNREYSKNEINFTTPKKIYTDDEIERMLLKSMKGDKYSYGTRKWIVTSTQRALSLINVPCGNLGINNYNLQLNQLKLEYSFNSFGRYTDWDAIDSIYDEETVNILMDIISVNEVPEYEDYFCPFIPTPHALSSYNKHDDEGGQFNAEQYLYDNLKNDDTAYTSYTEYPWLYESSEFQKKYSQLIKENENDEQLSEDINLRIAENKFLFSYYSREYMDAYAVPQDRTIKIMFSGEVTVHTAVAFSYLSLDIPRGYDALRISTCYRDYVIQAYFYTRSSTMEKAFLSREDSWHLARQNDSYVPGFSNHQYGIALDFQDIATFGKNPLYEYMNENANKYGFYNYYREPWHWVYLGE